MDRRYHHRCGKRLGTADNDARHIRDATDQRRAHLALRTACGIADVPTGYGAWDPSSSALTVEKGLDGLEGDTKARGGRRRDLDRIRAARTQDHRKSSARRSGPTTMHTGS